MDTITHFSFKYGFNFNFNYYGYKYIPKRKKAFLEFAELLENACKEEDILQDAKWNVKHSQLSIFVPLEGGYSYIDIQYDPTVHDWSNSLRIIVSFNANDSVMLTEPFGGDMIPDFIELIKSIEN